MRLPWTYDRSTGYYHGLWLNCDSAGTAKVEIDGELHLEDLFIGSGGVIDISKLGMLALHCSKAGETLDSSVYLNDLIAAGKIKADGRSGVGVLKVVANAAVGARGYVATVTWNAGAVCGTNIVVDPGMDSGLANYTAFVNPVTSAADAITVEVDPADASNNVIKYTHSAGDSRGGFLQVITVVPGEVYSVTGRWKGHYAVDDPAVTDDNAWMAIGAPVYDANDIDSLTDAELVDYVFADGWGGGAIIKRRSYDAYDSDWDWTELSATPGDISSEFIIATGDRMVLVFDGGGNAASAEAWAYIDDLTVVDAFDQMQMDFDGDCTVGLSDLALFSVEWLKCSKPVWQCQ